MSILGSLADALARSTLNATGQKVGTAIGEKLANYMSPSKPSRGVAWSVMLAQNVAVACAMHAVRANV